MFQLAPSRTFSFHLQHFRVSGAPNAMALLFERAFVWNCDTVPSRAVWSSGSVCPGTLEWTSKWFSSSCGAWLLVPGFRSELTG